MQEPPLDTSEIWAARWHDAVARGLSDARATGEADSAVARALEAVRVARLEAKGWFLRRAGEA